MTDMSFPSAFVGNPSSNIQAVMDSRLRGNEGFWGFIRHFAKDSRSN